MPPENRLLSYIVDMVVAITTITDYISGMKFEDFKADDRVKSAVKWQFIIIGEAANRLTPEFITHHSHIPWHEIRGMRNRLAHEYDKLDDRILWETIQQNLPTLLSQLLGLIPQSPDTSPS